MARRSSRRIKSPDNEPTTVVISDPTSGANSDLCAAIMEKIDKAPIYSLAAPETLPIKQHDGQYRNRPIPTEEEFTLKGCRIGARNQVIFEFQPMDPTKFAQVELEEKNVFTAFEGFENIACAALGYGNTWPHAKKAWLSGYKRRAAEAVEQAEVAAKREIEDAYGSNSAFGSW